MVRRGEEKVEVMWTPAVETGVGHYIVVYGPDGERNTVTVTEPRAILNVGRGTIVGVKAVNDRGIEGWDWAWTAVE